MKTFKLPLSNEAVTLTGYLLGKSDDRPDVRVRPAVLVLPGGGYRMCSNREAEPVALAYAAEGYNTFVLRYSVGPDAPATKAFDDAREAMAHLHEHAEEYRIDKNKIAVIGFSAGGHLAAWLSVYGEIKPNASILGYPCILLNMKKVLGGKELPDICAGVDEKTPPAFIFHTRNDGTVPVENALRYADVLDKAGVGFEMHIFRDGVHGLSLAKELTSGGDPKLINGDAARWMPLSVRWLASIFADKDV